MAAINRLGRMTFRPLLATVLVAAVLIGDLQGRWSAAAQATSEAATPPPAATTEDISGITITQLHLFIVPLGDSLQIAESYVLSNSGSETYVGSPTGDGQRITVRFSLPQGATALSFDEESGSDRYVVLDEGFGDTLPIPPGEGTLLAQFSYQVPYQPGEMIQRSTSLPVTAAAVFLVGETLALQGPGFAQQGVMDTQMGPTTYYTAGSLAAGQALAFVLFPQASPGQAPSAPAITAPSRNSGLELGIGLLALAVAAGLAYFLWRPSGVSTMPDRVHPQVAQIAELDASFTRGDVDESTYEKRRRALKRQVQAALNSAGPGKGERSARDGR